MHRLSLRARLVVGVLALAAVGLVAADVATYTSLRSFLFDRVDSTLNDVHRGIEDAVFGKGPGLGEATVSGDCIEVRRLSGSVIYTRCFGAFPGAPTPVQPKLPAALGVAAPRATSFSALHCGGSLRQAIGAASSASLS